MEEAKRVIPQILNGDPKYGFPSLNPLILPSVELSPGSNLKMSFKDLEVRGLETLDITEFE